LAAQRKKQEAMDSKLDAAIIKQDAMVDDIKEMLILMHSINP